MRRGTWDDAVALVPDGATVGFSGAILRGKPVAAAVALARAGRRDLDLVTFTGSLEVEVLLAAGALRSVTSSYVGLGPHGAARGFAAAVADGTVEDRELSEWMLVGGLRAATMGAPFLATRAGLGSELVEARGLRTVTDPYTGEGVYWYDIEMAQSGGRGFDRILPPTIHYLTFDTQGRLYVADGTGVLTAYAP